MTSINAFGDNLLKIMEKGIKCDSWGQRLEAAEEYKRVHTEYHEGMTNFAMDDVTEKKLQKIMKNIRNRGEQLQNNSLSVNTMDVSMDQIKNDYECFKEIISKFQATLNRRHSSVAIECGQITSMIPFLSQQTLDLLLPSPKRKSQHATYLTIKIDKIGLKDAHTYVDPFFTVSVKDKHGEDLTALQHTPASYHVAERYLIFDMNVHIQKPIEEFVDDFAVFFEFKHYKEVKDKVSTRCYSFVEKDEIKEGITHKLDEQFVKHQEFSMEWNPNVELSCACGCALSRERRGAERATTCT